MSRKVGYAFQPVPSPFPPHWLALSFFQRCIMLGAWIASDEKNRIEVTADWERSLCRTLEIDGGERTNAQRAMRILARLGLIEVSASGYVQLLFRPSSGYVPETFRARSAGIPEVDKPSESLNSHLTDQSRADTDTDHTTTERPSGGVVSAPPAWVPKSKTRPDLDGFNWFNELKGGVAPPLHTCKVDYEWIGGRPAPERHQVAQSIAATQWCADNRRNVTPAHVVKYWASYLEGPRNRQPAVAAVSAKDAAYTRMKVAEKAYREAERYKEPSAAPMALWKQAAAEYHAMGDTAEKAVAS